MSNVNWSVHLQNRLYGIADVIQSGDVGAFDTSYSGFVAKYGQSYNIPEEMARFVREPEGMSLLQFAVLSGNPAMVQRVYDIVSSVPTFTIEYRIPKNGSEYAGKTARGIVDIMLGNPGLDPATFENYATIKKMLIESGASPKFPRTQGLRTAMNFVTSIVRGGKRRTYRRRRRQIRKQSRKNKRV